MNLLQKLVKVIFGAFSGLGIEGKNWFAVTKSLPKMEKKVTPAFVADGRRGVNIPCCRRTWSVQGKRPLATCLWRVRS